MIRNFHHLAACVTAAALLTASCGFKRKKYENPISKDTQQPDKVLFDKAIKDIEHGRYEVARLTLNTLVNTYDTSEYLAKAKLAIADSWYREGGLHGFSQAEAEYKDFILFYPTMEEAAESQEKICMIHFTQMDKADRDPNNGLRAEQECRTLITQFPIRSSSPRRCSTCVRCRKCWRKRNIALEIFITRRARTRRRRTGWERWWINIRCIATRIKRCGWKRIRIAEWGRGSGPRRAMRSPSWLRNIR